MTNAERIKIMTVDELLGFMDALGIGDIKYARYFCDLCDEDNCAECCKWWLEQDTDGVQGTNSPYEEDKPWEDKT